MFHRAGLCHEHRVARANWWKNLGCLIYLYNRLCDEPRGGQCICDSGSIIWPQQDGLLVDVLLAEGVNV